MLNVVGDCRPPKPDLWQLTRSRNFEQETDACHVQLDGVFTGIGRLTQFFPEIWCSLDFLILMATNLNHLPIVQNRRKQEQQTP
jgi:hypothetical protein